MTYPDGIDALVNVNAGDTLAAGGHAARHNSALNTLRWRRWLRVGRSFRSCERQTAQAAARLARHLLMHAVCDHHAAKKR
jgi:hypothetical protein